MEKRIVSHLKYQISVMNNTYFIVNEKTTSRLRIAMIAIFIILLYFEFRGRIIESSYDNALFMLFYPILKSAVFNTLVALALMLGKCLFYFEFMLQFRQRNSWAQWLCLSIIVMMVLIFVLGLLPSTLWLTMSLIVPNILGLVNSLLLLMLSVVFISRFRGYIRLAGICLAVTLLLPYVFSMGFILFDQYDILSNVMASLGLITLIFKCLTCFYYFRSFRSE
ncbi:MAG: hypothetical protein ACOYJK_09665 [Prevotella sp.]|jgi:hypothetical protein